MLSSDRWREVSPHLDHALALPDEERTEWVASFRGSNPELGALLAALLEEHRVLASEEFLERRQPAIPRPAGLAGQSIGAYTLVSQIGQGGMGSVWLAERSDGRFERKVAVKFLNIALAGRRGEQQFKREGSILARLSHPHIADLVDAGVSPIGQPFLVLEYVEGEHIDRYCDQRALSVGARIRLFLQVLAAVAHAHSSLVVHRDLKPSNVLVGRDGKVKLLDFGIAKLLEREGESGANTLITVDGARPMTPEYAAPEQLRGGAVTTGTDVYGLGVLLYVLLTGQHPAGAGPHSHADLVKAIVDGEPARPSEAVDRARTGIEIAFANAAKRATTADKLRRMLRGDLDNIVSKALKKDSQERYVSVGAMADDLRRYLRNEPVGARPDTIAYRAAKFLRRNRAAVALATLAGLAIVGGLVGTIVQARTASIQRDFALRQVARSAELAEFHQFLLSDAAPSGKPLSVRALLNRAEQIIARQHAANDPNRVELMVSIGRQYLAQDEVRSARRLLEEAYRLSRGLSDASVRAVASCSLAVSLARDEELGRAEKLFQQGLQELPDAPQFALERIACLQSGSTVAQERNDVRQGIARAEAAQRVLRQSAFDSDTLEMHRWINLAKVYRTAGEAPEAIAAFQRAAVLLSSLGRDDTDSAATLFNEWALELDQMGRPLEAERLFRRSMDISRSGQAEEGISPIVLTNYARTLLELARIDDAVRFAERAYAEGQRAGHQVAVSQALLVRARIYNAAHQPYRAAAVLAEVQPRLERSLPAGHYAFASLASEQALNALERGDRQAALRLADQAVFVDQAAIRNGTDGHLNLPKMLIRRSAIELEAGLPERAEADANHALSELQRTVPKGAFSSMVGSAYLNLGRALAAQGRRDEARPAFQSASQHLESTLGPDHPDTRLAKAY